MADGYGMVVKVQSMEQVDAIGFTKAGAAMVSGHKREIETAVWSEAVNDGFKILFDADIFGMCLSLLRCGNLRYPDVIARIVFDVFAGIYGIC